MGTRLLVGTPQLMARALVIPVVMRSRCRQVVLTLYAQWQINSVTLTYDAQGGVGEPGDQSGDAGSDVTVSSTVPARDGYTFTGWNTAADGSGTGYSGGDAFTLPSSGSDTLYAQWQINSVTLTYDAQGGVGEPVISLVMRVVM